MDLKYIQTNNAPRAVGPYSQAVKAGSMLFVSGQLPIDPATGEMVSGDAAAQAKQCLRNIMAILEAEKLTAGDIIRMTVYLRDMNDFSLVNEIYATFFKEKYPARVCVEVSKLPKEAAVEIDAIAGS
jgi:2-iminobutanoate/2-iminopropanoate deaminase